MNWETVIGLEVHVQLSTRSKIFSGASTAFGADPNTHACDIDVALPGVLPVLNGAAVAKAVRFGLAVGATINRRSIFARKNYFYPDLPKGYQISQYEIPVVQSGSVEIVLPGGGMKTVRLTRAHLEEDAGKSLHEDFHGMTGIDLNRAGTPLLEIVSEPDMRGAAEAVAYGKALHALVRWLDICDGNMQEGSFRMDANVSVRPAGSDKLGTRCEIKNLNSFRFLERAIDYEVRRQIEVLSDGGVIRQETRLYDPDRDETRTMRSKEDAHDYRYFPDPDLLPLEITEPYLAEVSAAMPELPAQKRSRFGSAYALSAYDASLLTGSRELADYFEAAAAGLSAQGAKLVANWITGALSAKLNEEDLDITGSKVSAAELRQLIERIADGTISGKLARDVFDAMWTGEGSADAIIERRGLRQISDSGELEKLVDEVVAANAAQIADYRAGKAKAFNALVGQVMKASKGKANPQQVNEILRRKLS
ncbi:MAG: Asp-tRNA(Asn)/Glu-tRNA(Gln) amidotransferase subunit GatB [Betaproteobacteria bacterium]|nr:MAG: Asp-tRNA(Asn)/Glu-tRNA(Gln) amidotransferase subunit GatB [Betaproteobacteria bacterium]